LRLRLPSPLPLSLPSFFDLGEAVEAPERLAVDEHERRAEHAARDGGVVVGAQPVLDFLAAHAGRQRGWIDLQTCSDAHHFLGIADVDAVDEKRMVERLDQLQHLRLAMVFARP
jgi:hypothetical protein